MALLGADVEDLDEHPQRREKERRIAAVPIQPALRPGSRLKPSPLISAPASGKASTSQPYAVADKR